MNELENTIPEDYEKKTHREAGTRLAGNGMLLGVFWVLFLWNFFAYGLLALGGNAAVFLVLLAIILLHKSVIVEGPLFSNFIWEVPLFLLALSYALYENPFIKACNSIALPAIFGVVLLHKSARNPERMFADGGKVFFLVCYAIFGPIGNFQRALSAQFHWFHGGSRLFSRFRSPVARSILKGVLGFLALAVFLVVPLLSTADATFAAAFEEFYRWLSDVLIAIFEEEFIWKLVAIGAVSVWFIMTALAWTVEGDISSGTTPAAERDSIAAGILLTGITVIYLIFLAIQLEKLFLTSLPVNFTDTERYVKQGFWQLIFLSTINLYLVLVYFKKTSPKVQYLLVSFTVVSLALLFSAAHRMVMYVIYYGLSYEKFYASYTVLFCVILFGMILFAFFAVSKRSILKDAILLVIWMYALVGLFPVERSIISFNHALRLKADSRIDLRDMNMLSLDALPYVRANKAILAGLPGANRYWVDVETWIADQELKLKKKKWYEQTVASLIAQQGN